MIKKWQPYALFALCLIIIAGLWLYSLSINLSQNKNDSGSIFGLFKDIKLDTNIASLKNTTTPTVTDELLGNLAEKIKNLDTWQTYRNEEYGFEMKIPANYITEQIDKGVSFTTNELITARQKNAENCNDNKNETVCAPEMVNNKLEFAAYFPFNDNEKLNKRTENLNGISWQTFEAPGLYPIIYYETQNSARQYHFASYLNKEEINQILSTFKFIE